MKGGRKSKVADVIGAFFRDYIGIDVDRGAG